MLAIARVENTAAGFEVSAGLPGSLEAPRPILRCDFQKARGGRLRGWGSLRQKELAGDFYPLLLGQSGGHVVEGDASVLRQGTESTRHEALQGH